MDLGAGREREYASYKGQRERAMRQHVNNQENLYEGYTGYIVIFLPFFHRVENFETEGQKK